jgi:hypothetical protein
LVTRFVTDSVPILALLPYSCIIWNIVVRHSSDWRASRQK